MNVSTASSINLASSTGVSSSSTDKSMLSSKNTSKTAETALDFLNKITNLLDSDDDTKAYDKTSKSDKKDILSSLKKLKASANDDETSKLIDELYAKISTLSVAAPGNSNINIDATTPNITAGETFSLGDINKTLKELISQLNTSTSKNTEDTNFSNIININNSKNTKSSDNTSITADTTSITMESLKNKLSQLLTQLASQDNKESNDSSIEQNTTVDDTQMFIKLLQKTSSNNNDKIVTNKNDLNMNVKDKVNQVTDEQSDLTKINSSSKEAKILKSNIGTEDDTKLNKIDTLMSQLNGLKQNITSVKVSDIPVINKSTMVNDIIETVKFMSKNQLQELTVKLNPNGLGEVVIKLTMEAGNMKANITANNKDTFNLLNSNLKDIETALNNTDLKVQNVNISLYQQNSSFNGGNSQQGSGGEDKNKQKNSDDNSIKDVSEISLGNIGDDIKDKDNNISILA